MSGFLFQEIVFGPVRSRRLGVSLGINLLPTSYKYCTYDCIYCECGWTQETDPDNKTLPNRNEIKEALEEKMKEMVAGEQNPDAITFAGNGEPTIHPEFAEIVDDTIALRDTYFPQAQISILSNASLIHKEKVFNALLKVDRNILKLDAGSEEMFQRINQPNKTVKFEALLNNLKRFNGKLIIQTLFLRGEYKGERIDNLSGEELELWVEHIKAINPMEVMIYPIDRRTPASGLEKASFEELSVIADRINNLGIHTNVYY